MKSNRKGSRSYDLDTYSLNVPSLRIVSALIIAVTIFLAYPARASSSPITVVGKVVAVRPGIFALDPGPSCGYKDVYFPGNTFFLRNGQTLHKGVYARVTGSGSCFTYVVATSVSLSASPFGTVRAHVMTAGHLGFGNGAAPWTRYAPYISLAETYPQNADGLVAAGISTMVYTNPNRQSLGQPLYTSDESTFAHTCSGGRIADISNRDLRLMNPGSTHLWTMWHNYISAVRATAQIDAIFSDDADDVYGITSMPCHYTSAAWLESTVNEDAAAGAPIIYNGLGLLGPGFTLSPALGLNASAIGGMMEACYAGFGTNKPGGPIWAAIENTELAMASQGKYFICVSNNYSEASAAIDARVYAYASFLLTYDLNTSAIWEGFETPSAFKVLPESQLVALNPVVSTPTSVASLLTPTAIYGREYRTCYLRGVYVGPCAAVVNSSYWSSYRFPYTKYHHTLFLQGNGVLDGGRIFTNGSAPPAFLPPLGSRIVFL